MDLGSAKYL